MTKDRFFYHGQWFDEPSIEHAFIRDVLSRLLKTSWGPIRSQEDYVLLIDRGTYNDAQQLLADLTPDEPETETLKEGWRHQGVGQDEALRMHEEALEETARERTRGRQSPPRGSHPTLRSQADMD